ncbi:MAG: hypothetical protein M1482_09460 [Chloroflexi bacterium]|nr:hypothetical protein [Chloroflexota bacterium]
MRNRIRHDAVVLATLAFAVVVLSACGIGGAPSVAGLVPNASAQQMWPDVPAFQGATQDPKEALGTSLFNQAQADQKSKMETMIFRTSRAPSEVADFYTADLMKTNGWDVSETSFSPTGCSQDHYENQPRTICSFSKKNEEGREIDLSIDARADPQANNTRLIYTRITGSLVTP